ncbi:hypothetical protein CEXT_53911 [Caerostris extrusa]|uniref:Uncharacterized protein n=1 Tax=Caerostris extrusa TaxID=172846 RepID=A0AAV4TUL4_CAEEX|nr:hypothetical protein CEXT_53911 [Caerostris extrusa]
MESSIRCNFFPKAHLWWFFHLLRKRERKKEGTRAYSFMMGRTIHFEPGTLKSNSSSGGTEGSRDPKRDTQGAASFAESYKKKEGPLIALVYREALKNGAVLVLGYVLRNERGEFCFARRKGKTEWRSLGAGAASFPESYKKEKKRAQIALVYREALKNMALLVLGYVLRNERGEFCFARRKGKREWRSLCA